MNLQRRIFLRKTYTYIIIPCGYNSKDMNSLSPAKNRNWNIIKTDMMLRLVTDYVRVAWNVKIRQMIRLISAEIKKKQTSHNQPKRLNGMQWISNQWCCGTDKLEAEHQWIFVLPQVPQIGLMIIITYTMNCHGLMLDKPKLLEKDGRN